MSVLTRTPAYARWRSMKKRCYCETSPNYALYGARGIAVCKRWRDSFWAFQNDMGDAPAGLSIGRIDNDWHYEPSNCRWENGKQQGNNKSNNIIVTAFGKTQTLQQWADETGIRYYTIWNRLERGVASEQALAIPPKRHRVFLSDAQVQEVRGLYVPGVVTHKQIAEIYGVSKSCIAEIVKNNRRTCPLEL